MSYIQTDPKWFIMWFRGSINQNRSLESDCITCCFCMIIVRLCPVPCVTVVWFRLRKIFCYQQVFNPTRNNSILNTSEYLSEFEMFNVQCSRTRLKTDVNVFTQNDWMKNFPLRRPEQWNNNPRPAILNWNITQALCHYFISINYHLMSFNWMSKFVLQLFMDECIPMMITKNEKRYKCKLN